MGYPDMTDVGPPPVSQPPIASLPTSTFALSPIAMQPSVAPVTFQTSISSLLSSATGSASDVLTSSNPSPSQTVQGSISRTNSLSNNPSHDTTRSSVSTIEIPFTAPAITGPTETVPSTPSTTQSSKLGSTSQNPAALEFPSSMSRDEKIGLIIGLVMFLLLIIVFAILFFKRYRQKDALFGGSMPAEMTSTSVFYARYENDSIPLIIEAGEPKGSLDSAGIRWPGKVMLAGEAKEVHDLTMEFEREYKERKAASSERREEERRAHWSAGNGGIVVIRDWI